MVNMWEDVLVCVFASVASVPVLSSLVDVACALDFGNPKSNRRHFQEIQM